MAEKFKAHVSESKKKIVKELASLMKSKTIMVISVKGLPSAQFQDIKKKLRSKAKVRMAKKNLVSLALDHSGIKELHELVGYVTDGTAILFSNSDAFEIAGILAEEKSPSKAKAGQIAPFDIEVKAGPTELVPGPDISALSAVGLVPKVEGGKISVLKDKVICQAGKEITTNIASIMAKLNIVPFEVGIDPVAAYMEGKVYSGIKINKKETIAKLEEAYGRSLPFAVELGYVTEATLDLILGKANAHEGVIRRIITGEPEPVAAVQVVKEEKKETKAEEKPAESAAGLASLFG